MTLSIYQRKTLIGDAIIPIVKQYKVSKYTSWKNALNVDRKPNFLENLTKREKILSSNQLYCSTWYLYQNVHCCSRLRLQCLKFTINNCFHPPGLENVGFKDRKRGELPHWSPSGEWIPAVWQLLQVWAPHLRLLCHGGLNLCRHSKLPQGRVKKFLLNRLVDFSIKWVGGLLLVH